MDIGIRQGFSGFVRLLNMQGVKEGVKLVGGVASFSFGVIEAFDLLQIALGHRRWFTDVAPGASNIEKMSMVAAKISLLLSASTSVPGLFLISKGVGVFFTKGQIEGVFGVYTTFAVNPRHPRHIVSIVAVILSMPATIYATYRGFSWVYRKVFPMAPGAGAAHHAVSSWTLTDAKVRLFCVFNTVFSRPTLHLGNQLARYLMHRV